MSSSRSFGSFLSSFPNRVVDVRVARPRAHDMEQLINLAALSVVSGILMAPSIIAALVLMGLL